MCYSFTLSPPVLTLLTALAHAHLPRMRFHVIGIGSIGSLLSYHLRRALLPQHRISLIVRRVNNHTEPPPNTPKRITIECNGLKASLDGFDVEYANPLMQDVYNLLRQKKQANMRRMQDLADAAAANPQDQPPGWIRRAVNSFTVDDRPHPARIDSLFVATKATAVVRAIEECKDRIHSGTTIVLLQNGMGIYEAVVNRLFPNPESRQILSSRRQRMARGRRRKLLFHTTLYTLELVTCNLESLRTHVCTRETLSAVSGSHLPLQRIAPP